MGFRDFGCKRFRLIIRQVNGEFNLKKIALVFYLTAVWKLIRSFFSIQFEHVRRGNDELTDVLVTLASKTDILTGQLM